MSGIALGPREGLDAGLGLLEPHVEDDYHRKEEDGVRDDVDFHCLAWSEFRLRAASIVV